MGLSQKYTWKQFVKDQGAKAKDLKRTSEEGAKAFEAALKEKTKAYVAKRIAAMEKQMTKAEKDIATFRGQLKGLKSAVRKTAVLKRISRRQHAMSNFKACIERDRSRSL